MAEERIRVLLLDDDEGIRISFKKSLERNWGYQVHTVSSGEEALELVEEVSGRLDVALIDELLAPGPSGIEVMKHIKARYPDIECIVFTGWGVEPRQRALRAGAFGYLEKQTLDMEELAMLIHTAAQKSRLRKISHPILSERNLERILEQIRIAARSLTPADGADIDLLDLATGQISPHAGAHCTGSCFQRYFKRESLSRQIIETGQSVHITDAIHDGRVNQEGTAQGLRSLAGIPIPSGGDRNLGVLYVYSQRPGQFDSGSTRALLQTLAGQAGLAIVNARAFQQVQTHADYMEALVRTGQGFTKATTQTELFDLAWEFVQQQLKVCTFFIALYEQQTNKISFPVTTQATRRGCRG